MLGQSDQQKGLRAMAAVIQRRSARLRRGCEPGFDRGARPVSPSLAEGRHSKQKRRLPPAFLPSLKCLPAITC